MDQPPQEKPSSSEGFNAVVDLPVLLPHQLPEVLRLPGEPTQLRHGVIIGEGVECNVALISGAD